MGNEDTYLKLIRREAQELTRGSVVVPQEELREFFLAYAAENTPLARAISGYMEGLLDYCQDIPLNPEGLYKGSLLNNWMSIRSPNKYRIVLGADPDEPERIFMASLDFDYSAIRREFGILSRLKEDKETGQFRVIKVGRSRERLAEFREGHRNSYEVIDEVVLRR